MNIIQNLSSSIIIILALGTNNANCEMSNSTSPSLVCSDALDCETCVRDSACFWCESKLSCKVYDASKKEVETKECGKLMWKNCKKPENPGVAHVISAVVSVILIIVLFGFISVKTELGSRIKSLKLWNKEEREGLFEQEERLNRKKKHKKAQSTKAKNFAEKYSLDESEIFLSP